MFTSSDNGKDIFANTKLSGFPAAGQQKEAALVETFEFHASTVMKEDGVQHEMYAVGRIKGSRV